MRIKTNKCLPFKTKFNILIPLKDEILSVPVQVSRLIKPDNICDGMGIRLLKQPQEYIELISSLKRKSFRRFIRIFHPIILSI